MPGTLFLVATPIGNLEDVTARALRVLREADVVAAEDTRRTARLLNHFGITTPLTSLHEHNEHRKQTALVERLLRGDTIALVSDAGTPLVSDPGAALVRAARASGVRVVAVPGPSAVLAALTASGLPCETFAFLGFLPARAAERSRWLRRVAAEPHTVVCFEAPHRLRQTLAEMSLVFGERQICLGRELTKVHEEVVTGTAGELLMNLQEDRGECTLVIAPDASASRIPDDAPDDRQTWLDFRQLTEQEGLGRREAVSTLARRYGRSARGVYAAIERARSSDARA